MNVMKRVFLFSEMNEGGGSWCVQTGQLIYQQHPNITKNNWRAQMLKLATCI